MEKRFDVVTAMDCCVDVLLQMGDTVPEFGQKELLIHGYHIALGGSACIFASQCAKLGLKTVGVGTVGDDLFGHMVKEELKAAGVNTEYVQMDKEIQTGIGVALNKNDGDRGILTYTGSIDKVSKTDFQKVLIHGRHLHIASYFLMKSLWEIYPGILKNAKELGITVSLDTNWDPAQHWKNGLENILKFVDVVLLNEEEVLAIAGMSELTKAAEWFLKRTKLLVVKQGNRGATAFTANQVLSVQSPSEKVIDTVGAGDSFDGGFLYGWLHQRTLKECLTMGCFCGSRTLRMAGGVAGQPDQRELCMI